MATDMLPEMIDIPTLHRGYAERRWAPAELLTMLAERLDKGDPAAFITRTPMVGLFKAAAALIARAPEPNSLPLWGIPFAVKDNIDVAGMPTTAACPAFSYIPDKDAEAVARLRAAGAIVIGKTNLDQFATGLNGTRSPYGAPRCVFNSNYISGGSSSGSAVAVASGAAAFALGTDTAGSGRVPAAFNNIVGIKPTPGLISTTGLVPACRSLDCISIFAATAADGGLVRQLIEGFDVADPFSRHAEPRSLPGAGLRIGILAADDRQFFGDREYERLYAAAIERAIALGATPVEIDYAPFRETAALLYDGPWVAERFAAFETFEVSVDELDPSVAAIMLGGQTSSAADAFRGQYRLAELRRRTEAEWARVDVLLLPTAPTIYRVDEMIADPIALNSRLGAYTNFFNLLGLSAIAVPAGFRSDGLPFGITIAAPSFSDYALIPIASALHEAAKTGAGRDGRFATPPPAAPVPDNRLRLAVVGAHLSGMALNCELHALGAMLERQCRTSADYRLYLLPGTTPAKPGLVREDGFAGPGIEIEIWSLPAEAFGRFVEAIPAPLGIGKIMLADGSRVSGFLCEKTAVSDAEEITAFGGWRNYMAAQTKPDAVTV
ncbi:MAG: allophanate hydrolase [Sphingomonadaceae bacterium]